MWPNDDDAIELVCPECLAHYRATGDDEGHEGDLLACVGCGTELVLLNTADLAA